MNLTVSTSAAFIDFGLSLETKLPTCEFVFVCTLASRSVRPINELISFFGVPS